MFLRIKTGRGLKPSVSHESLEPRICMSGIANAAPAAVSNVVPQAGDPLAPPTPVPPPEPDPGPFPTDDPPIVLPPIPPSGPVGPGITPVS